MKLEIITPFGRVLQTECDEAVIPGFEGEMGILPEHLPLLTIVPAGVLWYKKDGKIKYVSVSNGYAEVYSDNILLLVETAEPAEKIDLQRAERNFERFKQEFEQYVGPMDKPEIKRLQIRLRREEARIKAYKLSREQNS